MTPAEAAVFLATAYAWGCGASGLTRTEGIPRERFTAAADPEVLPLGSIIELEGIGARLVEDTGRLVLGRRVDLYVGSCAEAMQWGVQPVGVRVLYRGTPAFRQGKGWQLKQAECKRCGAAIIWARTKNGKNMPLDAEPNSAGKWLLVEAAGQSPDAVRMRDAEAAKYTGEKYEAHWATCPNAEEFRKSAPPKARAQIHPVAQPGSYVCPECETRVELRETYTMRPRCEHCLLSGLIVELLLEKP